MKKQWVIVLMMSSFTFIYQGVSMNKEINTELSSLFPSAVDGWGKTEDQFYDRENLYEYIDGGAELYLSYGFQRVLSRRYHRDGQPMIVVDVFDMKESANAFGLFCHSREMVDSTYGQGSQSYPGLLTFWKDRYYVSILASPETPESKKAIANLARKIEEKIDKTGELPEILKYLPQKNLKEESIRYFTHHTWLNSHFFIADENIFQISEETPAVLARYPGQGILLIVIYPDPAPAQAAYQAYEKYFAAPNASQGTVQNQLISHPEGQAPAIKFLTGIKITQLEDGSWTGARLYDRQFVAVFQGAGEEQVAALIADVPKNLNQK